MEKQFKLKKTVVIVAIVWGFLLAIGGVLSGNQALNTPEAKRLEGKVLKEKIASSTLSCWISHQRSDFRIVEFADANGCSSDFTGFNLYKCYDIKNINNLKWVRNALRNLDRELIVFGSTPKDSLVAASTLKAYGYNVRMLDKDSAINLQAETAQPAKTGVSQVKTRVTVPVSKPSNFQPIEEEGC